jgi:hypothetical protein
VAEGARLEIVCIARYQGFESLPLRTWNQECDADEHHLESSAAAPPNAFMVLGDATTVNPARPGREQR